MSLFPLFLKLWSKYTNVGNPGEETFLSERWDIVILAENRETTFGVSLPLNISGFSKISWFPYVTEESQKLFS